MLYGNENGRGEILMPNKTKRTHKLNILLTAVLIVAVFMVFNGFLQALSSKVQLSFDLTPNRLFVLSDETKNYLDNLNEDITFKYMVEQGKESPYVEQVIERYARYCGRIRIEKIDPVANPVKTVKYVSDGETLEKGSIAVESGKRFTVVDPGSALTIIRDKNGNVTRSIGFVLEQKLTNAIDYTVREKTVKVKYADGHNALSFAVPASKLKAENMSVEKTVLADDELTAENTELLILYGFRDDLSSEEYEKVKAYLENGGSAFITLDAGVELERLSAISEEYGITVENNILEEGNKGEILADSALNLITIPEKHEICTGLENSRILFAAARTLSFKEKDGVKSSYLIKSKPSAKKCEIEDGEAGRKLEEGSFGLAAVAEKGKSKLFVAGTSKFLAPDSQTLSNILNYVDYQNREFFVQTVKYLTDSEDLLVSVAPKSIESRTLSLTNNMKFLYILIFAGILPLAVFAAGVVVWFKRRNL